MKNHNPRLGQPLYTPKNGQPVFEKEPESYYYDYIDGLVSHERKNGTDSLDEAYQTSTGFPATWTDILGNLDTQTAKRVASTAILTFRAGKFVYDKIKSKLFPALAKQEKAAEINKLVEEYKPGLGVVNLGGPLDLTKFSASSLEQPKSKEAEEKEYQVLKEKNTLLLELIKNRCKNGKGDVKRELDASERATIQKICELFDYDKISIGVSEVGGTILDLVETRYPWETNYYDKDWKYTISKLAEDLKKLDSVELAEIEQLVFPKPKENPYFSKEYPWSSWSGPDRL